MVNHSAEMMEKIEGRTLTVAVAGLGYVGLPLAVEFAGSGIQVVGYDRDAELCSRIQDGNSHIADVEEEKLSLLVKGGTLTATADPGEFARCDVILIAVPTPLNRFRQPDTSHIEDACREVGRNMKPGTFVCLESTTYPTTTEELMLPILEKSSGMKEGSEFWLAYSPERIDPGNKRFNTGNTPKVIGALGEEGLRIGIAIYSLAIEHIHPVSSPRTAEMVKILENTYRLINISLINELALLTGRMGIDIWEVIDAAATKPFGYHPFYPGPGIGGHCIPLDPFYLEYIAKRYNFDLTMIHTAGIIESLMPHRMVVKLAYALNRIGKPIKGSRFLFIGVAYKPDVTDCREAPALKIISEVIRKEGEVGYHDPYVDSIEVDERVLHSRSLTVESLQSVECVVIVTKHSGVDYQLIRNHSRLIVDLQNTYPNGVDSIVKL